MTAKIHTRKKTFTFHKTRTNHFYFVFIWNGQSNIQIDLDENDGEKKVTHTQCARQPLIWNCYRIDGVSVTLKTSGWKEHREREKSERQMTDWIENVSMKKDRRKSQFLCLEQTLNEWAGDEKAIRVQIK